MPPEGDTTVTINDEVAANLSRVMARHDVESMSLALDHAAQSALNENQ
jgi:chemotaxis protein CheY-P-specific phosphatase CheC